MAGMALTAPDFAHRHRRADAPVDAKFLSRRSSPGPPAATGLGAGRAEAAGQSRVVLIQKRRAFMPAAQAPARFVCKRAWKSEAEERSGGQMGQYGEGADSLAWPWPKERWRKGGGGGMARKKGAAGVAHGAARPGGWCAGRAEHARRRGRRHGPAQPARRRLQDAAAGGAGGYRMLQQPEPSPFSKVKRAARVAASKTSSTPSPLRLEHSR